jgi:hypothetical protein
MHVLPSEHHLELRSTDSCTHIDSPSKYFLRPVGFFFQEPSIRFGITTILSIALCLVAGGAWANAKNSGVLLDGLTVLAGGESGAEFDAMPILLSDIEFEATLFMIIEQGPTGAFGAIPPSARIRARRYGVLVRLLARQAKLFQDMANPSDVATIKTELIQRAGGHDAMKRVLKRFGMNDDNLTNWIKTALMVSIQIGQIVDQLSLETGIYGSKMTSYGQRDKQTVRKWLAGILLGNHVRILR